MKIGIGLTQSGAKHRGACSHQIGPNEQKTLDSPASSLLIGSPIRATTPDGAECSRGGNRAHLIDDQHPASLRSIHPVLLGKTAASIDQLSGGRFTLGLAAGGRPDDFEVTGATSAAEVAILTTRSRSCTRCGVAMPQLKGSSPASPTPTHDERVPILFGGNSDKTIERVLSWELAGLLAARLPAQSGPYATKVRDAWSAAGRDGEPRIASLAYFSLGEDAGGGVSGVPPPLPLLPRRLWADDRERRASIRLQVTDAVKAFEDAGFTELYFDPTVAKLDQIDRLR